MADEIVDVLVSARGTREQIAFALRTIACDLRSVLPRMSCGLGEGTVTSVEYDVLEVPDPGRPRISNRAVLAADAAGVLDIYDPDADPAESAMRGDGDGVAGL